MPIKTSINPYILYQWYIKQSINNRTLGQMLRVNRCWKTRTGSIKPYLDGLMESNTHKKRDCKQDFEVTLHWLAIWGTGLRQGFFPPSQVSFSSTMPRQFPCCLKLLAALWGWELTVSAVFWSYGNSYLCRNRRFLELQLPLLRYLQQFGVLGLVQLEILLGHALCSGW